MDTSLESRGCRRSDPLGDSTQREGSLNLTVRLLKCPPFPLLLSASKRLEPAARGALFCCRFPCLLPFVCYRGTLWILKRDAFRVALKSSFNRVTERKLIIKYNRMRTGNITRHMKNSVNEASSVINIIY